MASDEGLDLKAAIMLGIEREMARLLSLRGELAPATLDNPGLGSGSFATSYSQTFATGYDSGTGTTTMPFTTDVSIVTNGSSGDIVTG